LAPGGASERCWVYDGLRDQLGVLHRDHDVAVLVRQGVSFLPDHDIPVGVLVYGNAAKARNTTSLLPSPQLKLSPLMETP
jgi:hypothetical protein